MYQRVCVCVCVYMCKNQTRQDLEIVAAILPCYRWSSDHGQGSHVVLKWLKYGSLSSGSDYSAGPSAKFLHVGNSNLDQLPCIEWTATWAAKVLCVQNQTWWQIYLQNH